MGKMNILRRIYKQFCANYIAVTVVIVLLFAICFLVGSPYKKSLDLINSGKYYEAIKYTTFWTKIVPFNPHWYSLRGYARFYTGDYEGAVSDYDKAYELRNDEYKSMNFDNKIYIKYFLQNYESALNDFDDAIENSQDGEKNSLLWDKAQFLYNIGKYSEALKIYNELITKAADDKIYLMENRLYYERAQVYFSLNKNEQARKDLDTAQKLNLDIEYQNAIPTPTFLLEEI